MTDLLIRGIPEHIHLQLKTRAESNGRSLNKEILALLEEAFTKWDHMPEDPPVPFKGTFEIDDAWLQWAKEEGRA